MNNYNPIMYMTPFQLILMHINFFNGDLNIYLRRFYRLFQVIHVLPFVRILQVSPV